MHRDETLNACVVHSFHDNHRLFERLIASGTFLQQQQIASRTFLISSLLKPVNCSTYGDETVSLTTTFLEQQQMEAVSKIIF